MNKKIVKLISGLLLGGSIGLMSFNVSVDAQIIILPNYGSTIYNPEIGSIYSSYSNIYPLNELYGGATRVDTRIEKEKWMTKNGLVPWWDDEYKEYESDVYVTFKFSKHIDTVVDFFALNLEELDILSSNMVSVGSNQILEYSKTITQSYEETLENIATKSVTGFIKSSAGIGLGASDGILSADAKVEYGGEIQKVETQATTHKFTHSVGETKKYTIKGIEGECYRWELRAGFDLYTIYHFKAKYHMVESGRLWNSIYYNIINDGYELLGINSYLVMIEGSTYEGLIKYKKLPSTCYEYDDRKDYPDSILYI